MLEALWSGVGKELARHWVTQVLTPAFAFWVGGLSLLWSHVHATGVAAHGWTAELTASAEHLGHLPVLVQGALVVGGLVLIAASAVVVERLTSPLIRLLEGYWTRPTWLRQLMVGYRRWRRAWVKNRVKPLELRQRRGTLTVAEYDELLTLRAAQDWQPAERLVQLEDRAAQGLTAQETVQLGRDLRLLRTTPERDDLRMPTRLGDALRTAERRPIERYGLDAVVCWPALWLVLPAETRTELTQARTALDAAVRGWLWGALFLVWTPVSWWAALIGVVVPLLTYPFGVLPRGMAFGELVITCYDVHRMALYDALHLPRPESPTIERTQAGPRVTAMLGGTLHEPGLRYRFEPPAKPEKPASG